MSTRPFAVVTGGSSGIGLELARQFATNGYDLLIAAEDRTHLEDAAQDLRSGGATVDIHAADLSREDAVDGLYRALGGRAVDALCVNAGIGLGGPFTDTDLQTELRMIDLNVRGAVQLSKLVARDMVARRAGRLLLTSSIAGTMPDPFEAIYGGTKVFLRWFGEALRNELKDSGVTVTVLMPSMTETDFFRRAEMMDTRAGPAAKDDPAIVAKAAFEALMAGKDKVIPTAKNKVMGVIADLLPDRAAAQAHRGLSEPGSAGRKPDPTTPLAVAAAALGIGALLFAGWRHRPHLPAHIGGTSGVATAKALHITLEARVGQEADVERLLQAILDEVRREPDTRPWFGVRRTNSTFEIFETFPNDAARESHLTGKGAALLMARSNAVLASPARIDRLDVLLSKPA